MKISECSGCGKLAIIETNLCYNCEVKTTAEKSQGSVNVNQTDDSQPFADSFYESESSFPAGETEVFPQQNDNFSNPQENFYYQQSRHFVNSNCRKCQISIPVSQIYCSECGKKGLPVASFIKIFAVVLVLITGFYFYRTFIRNSPSAIFEKYERTTGTDNFTNLESLSFSGKATISGKIRPHIDVTDPAFWDASGINGPSKIKARMNEKDLTYSMIFKNPNKSSFEVTKFNQIIFKQVFDGINGWKLTHMPGQKSRLEDTGDGFSGNEMGLGIGDFDRVEFLNDEIKAEYGNENINLLKGLSTYWVNDKWFPTESKVFVSVKKIRNGKYDAALMMFDEKTGLLLDILKKELINGSTVITRISTSSYKTVLVKDKPGGTAKSLLLPERWVIEMEELNTGGTNDSLYITIVLYIDNVEVGIPIDESIFVKPASY